MTDQRYIGPADLHDAHMAVDHDRDNLIVNIRSHEGRTFGVKFYGVREMRNKSCEAMMLYALIENHAAARKQYVFIDWDGDSLASFKITADGFEVVN